METFWNGEPCEARIVRVIVADAEFPRYWAREFVGQEREAVEITYRGEKSYIDNEGIEQRHDERFGTLPGLPPGHGWHKVTEGRGSPNVSHADLVIERVIDPGEAVEPDDGAAMAALRQIAEGVPRKDEWRSAASFMEHVAEILEHAGVQRPDHYVDEDEWR